jgi:hypothetical protein
MVFIGLQRAQAEELASQANELVSTPRPAALSRYFSLLSIFYWPAAEQPAAISTSLRVVEGEPGRHWVKTRT